MKLTIGESIKQCRLKSGMKITAVSQKTGLWKKDICMYEANERTPSMFTALSLADLYNVTLDELVGRTVVNG